MLVAPGARKPQRTTARETSRAHIGDRSPTTNEVRASDPHVRFGTASRNRGTRGARARCSPRETRHSTPSYIHAPSDHLAHPTRYMSCTKIHIHTRSPHGMGPRRAVRTDRTDRQVRGVGTRPRECRDRVGPLEARRATPDRGERGERASLSRKHCSAKDTAADGGGIWVALCVELGSILPPPPRTSSGTPRRSPSCRP